MFYGKRPAPLLLAAFAAALAVMTFFADQPVAARPYWNWPLVGKVVREFVKPETDWGEGHRGLDVQAGPGAIVRSPLSGEVTFTGMVAGRELVVVSADGFDVEVEPVLSTVSVGQSVKNGDELGKLVAGHGGGNALHIGIRFENEYIDPESVLGPPPEIVVLDSWLVSYALG